MLFFLFNEIKKKHLYYFEKQIDHTKSLRVSNFQMGAISGSFKKSSFITRRHLAVVFLRNLLLVFIFTIPVVTHSMLLFNAADYNAASQNEKAYSKNNEYYKEKVLIHS